MMTQMFAKKGIKKFGEVAVAAMIKELKLLDQGAMECKPVVVPQDPDKLIIDKKRGPLEAVNLSKEKCMARSRDELVPTVLSKGGL